MDPLFELRAGVHILRHQLVVKSVDQFVVHQHVLAPCLVLQVLHLGDEFAVVCQEGKRCFPLVADECFANENVARGGRLQVAKVHPLVVVDDDAVKRGALQRNHLTRFLFPVRLQQLRLQQMPCCTDDPLRLDASERTAIQACGFNQFSRYQPTPRLFAEVRAGVAPKLDAACAEVPLFVVALASNVAQQAREHGQVHLFVGCRCGVQTPAMFCHHGEQLRMNVTPFTHTAHADEMLSQALFLLAVGELVLGLVLRVDGRPRRHLADGDLPCFGHHRFAVPAPRLNPFPQFEITHELGALIVKDAVLLVRCLGLLHGPVAHVLPTQRRRNDEHFAERLARTRFQDHAADARVQRQARKLSAHLGELVVRVHGRQLFKQGITVGNGLARWCFKERKIIHIAQAQRLHAQDHAGK